MNQTSGAVAVLPASMSLYETNVWRCGSSAVASMKQTSGAVAVLLASMNQTSGAVAVLPASMNQTSGAVAVLLSRLYEPNVWRCGRAGWATGVAQFQSLQVASLASKGIAKGNDLHLQYTATRNVTIYISNTRLPGT